MGTRKELFILLGVAAAVAVISTGLFYGLVVNKLASNAAENTKDGQPTQQTAPSGADERLGIPNGMRAVSVHVMDSSGVVRLLKPGHRVDVQMVFSMDGRPGNTSLRTVAQNLEIYQVEAANADTSREDGRGAAREHSSPSVVTLLAHPDVADALGLADTAARIRLLLRHPKDGAVTVRNSVELKSLTTRP